MSKLSEEQLDELVYIYSGLTPRTRMTELECDTKGDLRALFCLEAAKCFRLCPSRAQGLAPDMSNSHTIARQLGMPLEEMRPCRRGGCVADEGSYPSPHMTMPLVGLGTEPGLAAAMTQPEEETQRTPMKRSASSVELELTPKELTPNELTPLGAGPSDVNTDNTSPTKGPDPEQAPEQVAPTLAPNLWSAPALGMIATPVLPVLFD